MAGALDFLRQLALVLGARAGLAARTDLALFGDETAQQFGVLVIDICAFFNAELANLGARYVSPWTALLWPLWT